MMSKQVSTAVDASCPYPATSHQLTFELERRENAPLRELLRLHGLRTSLFRLKVLNALALAMQEGRSIGVRGVHTHLESHAVELSIVSVREVLKRLAEEGVIVFQADKTYRFTAQAWVMLQPHFE